ncbi:hypothetical protein SAMN05428969_3527 [Devosia sp. YR412]|uniref:hypothetical protein n=1 Tax=Devosia sp. YR412 TaxID=1881030 RepID=UPI0008B41A79|nr:hypothetical protein [Devosia sp. YR412]SEQ56882.1 hypothetical protein SAMN05428969_3527 [Devosia sp. YR412]
MLDRVSLHAGLAALAVLMAAGPANAQSDICVDCIQIRVGPPSVLRGPFPDELDAAFTAIKLPDGTFRGFSANGSTYAIDGASLADMGGERREVMQPGPEGAPDDCGRWLTSLTRTGDELLGLVHQEHDCDYNAGRTEKSMAMATSSDDGLTWTDLGTVVTGTDLGRGNVTTGEGDCTMVDGFDGYLYAYCLRASDWQTIIARAEPGAPTVWHKYFEGGWTEPGLGGQSTDIGFVGIGTGYLRDHSWVAAVATDPWFGGLRLSLSADKVSFVDLKEPLLTIDGSDWNRPADSDLIAYETILDPASGSNVVGDDFILSYTYVPPGKGFESRYLVQQDVTLTLADTPQPVQVGMALARWVDPEGTRYVTSTGPLTGERQPYGLDTVVAHMLTRAPDGVASLKLAECSNSATGDQLLADDGHCDADFARERTAGWLYAEARPGTVPVYRCVNDAAQSHFASSAQDCEGLGRMEFLLGHGLTP